MNLTLKRISYKNTGIYSVLSGDNFELYTLEHAYFEEPPAGSIWASGCEKYDPKIPSGTYECIKSLHKLEHYNSEQPFYTYEVMNVPNHTGILFHPGNVNKDSDGCILVGMSIGHDMILNSREAFAKFMLMQTRCDEFQLTVIA